MAVPVTHSVDSLCKAVADSLVVHDKKKEERAKELFEAGKSAWDRKQFSEALERFREAESLVQHPQDVSQTLLLASILNAMGCLYQENNDWGQALACHTRAFERITQVQDKRFPTFELAFIHANLSYVHSRMNTYTEALRHYSQAVRMESELTIPGAHPINASTFDGCSIPIESIPLITKLHQSIEKAMFAQWPGLTEEPCGQVDAISKRIVDLRETALQDEEMLENDLLPIIRSYTTLAMHLRLAGRLSQAKQCFELCLDTYGYCDDKSDTAYCYEGYGALLRDLGDYEQAKEQYKRALGIRDLFIAPEEPHLAFTLEYIEREKVLIQKNQERLEEYARAACAFDSLGMLFSEQGRFSEAMEEITHALEIRRRLFGEQHENYVLSLINKGKVLREMGRFRDALECHNLALELGGASFYLLQSLALVLLDLDQIDEAMKRYEQATKYLGPIRQHRHLALAGEEIANANGALGKYHEALQVHQGILELREKIFGLDSQQVATSLCSLGQAHHRLGNFAEELPLYDRALAIQMALTEKAHPLFAVTLDSKACCLAKLEKFDDALKLHQQALAIRQTLFTKSHPLVAQSLDNIGLLYSHLANYDEAKKSFQEALQIRQSFYDAEHPLIKLSESYIESCTDVVRLSQYVDGSMSPYLSREDFLELISHAKSFLETESNLTALRLEKNPTGFVRLRLPVPEKYKSKIEVLRLNFWTPQVKITMVEAPHNHPRYFESMILKGGYVHKLFAVQPSSSPQAPMHMASRIFKSTAADKRSIFSLGKVHLECMKQAETHRGAVVAFPRGLIHQVTTTTQGSMSINCVMRHKDNRVHYDVFMPKASDQDPQVEREASHEGENASILSAMKAILAEWVETPSLV